MAKKKSIREETEKGDVKSTIRSLLKPEVAVGVLAVFILLAFVALSSPNTLSSSEAAEKLVTWLKNYFQSRGIPVDIQLKGVKDVGSVYEVNLVLTVSGRSEHATYYISKDGKYFFPIGIKLEPVNNVAKLSSPPKSDRPTVELFVMSYCPYGMQMEKAIIPVLRLLGDKVDFKLRFVNYIMHGEKEVWENVRQYCIQKEYGTEKLLDYLECFVITNPDDPETCMKITGIDKNTIERCIEEVNREYQLEYLIKNSAGRFPPFPLDDKKNVEYGVRGSPTLVINGVKVNVTRSPEAIKQVICSAFTTPPPECNQTLSSVPASPGFGEGEGTETSAQCG